MYCRLNVKQGCENKPVIRKFNRSDAYCCIEKVFYKVPRVVFEMQKKKKRFCAANFVSCSSFSQNNM